MTNDKILFWTLVFSKPTANSQRCNVTSTKPCCWQNSRWPNPDWANRLAQSAISARVARGRRFLIGTGRVGQTAAESLMPAGYHLLRL
jgi:hypothetical protein